MPRPPRSGLKPDDLARAAADSLEAGKFELAQALLGDAIALKPRVATYRVGRALAAEPAGDIQLAASDLSVALRLEPRRDDALRLLAGLAARFVVPAPEALDPLGLAAALAGEGVALEPVARLAIAHVIAASRRLSQALSTPNDGHDAVADALVMPHLEPGLADPLLHRALSLGTIEHPDVERLFTAVRAALLRAGPDALTDRHRFALVLALGAHGSHADFAWYETDAETAAIERLAIDRQALCSGYAACGLELALRLMYRPIEQALSPPLAPDEALEVRPKALRDRLLPALTAMTEEREIAARLPRLAPIADAVSQRVARQYERAPYPRWQTLTVTRPGSLLAAIDRLAPGTAERLAGRPFEVLIAGAGTGQQAIRSGLGYGPRARITAIDLSAPSLAYALRMARRYGPLELDGHVGDILDVRRLGRSFDIIECVGVLHHMQDPFAGWRALLDVLAPDGLMYVGLYSRLARAEIRQLREAPEWPGPDASDPMARAWRRQLLERRAGEPGAGLRGSSNFYTLSEFRDLVLHPNEHHLTLEEIQSFLEREALEFLGFTLPRPILEAFNDTFPKSGHPGMLEDWATFEREHPRTFEAMYCFWCRRRSKNVR